MVVYYYFIAGFCILFTYCGFVGCDGCLFLCGFDFDSLSLIVLVIYLIMLVRYVLLVGYVLLVVVCWLLRFALGLGLLIMVCDCFVLCVVD